jgi:hypothetical protein
VCHGAFCRRFVDVGELSLVSVESSRYNYSYRSWPLYPIGGDTEGAMRLDVIMNEDQDRTRLDNGPHNPAVLRHKGAERHAERQRGKLCVQAGDDRFLAGAPGTF